MDLTRLPQYLSKNSKLLAFLLLMFMFVRAFWSVSGIPFTEHYVGENAVNDELPHLAAGYAMLKHRDYRLNPEHPPLLKMIAATPLLFLDVNPPEKHQSWDEGVNNQWDVGRAFLYENRYSADTLLLLTRLPFLLIMVALGALLYRIGRRIQGPLAGLLAVVMYSFSAIILSHGRYVTTDLGVTFFMLAGLYAFWRLLQKPSRWRIVVAGVLLAFAMLSKFSAVLLVPFLALCALLYFVINRRRLDAFRYLTGLKEGRHAGWSFLLSVLSVFIIAEIIIVLVYSFALSGMPVDEQSKLHTFYLASERALPLQHYLNALLSGSLVVRAVVHYVFGFTLSFFHAFGLHPSYLFGQFDEVGWWYYFPVAFALKESVAFHVLWIVGLIAAIVAWARSLWRSSSRRSGLVAWVREHLLESMLLLFLIVYGVISLVSSLNIGVRYILPIIPIIVVLASKQLALLLTQPRLRYIPVIIIAAFVWLGGYSLVIHPYYLTSMTELVGGPSQGYQYLLDSNYDWGQDLHRLAVYLDENDISHIKLDYFGEGDPEYYLGDRFEPWTSSDENASGIIVVSAMKYVPNWYAALHNEGTTYEYLDQKGELVDRIGNSLFIYRMPESGR